MFVICTKNVYSQTGVSKLHVVVLVEGLDGGGGGVGGWGGGGVGVGVWYSLFIKKKLHIIHLI